MQSGNPATPFGLTAYESLKRGPVQLPDHLQVHEPNVLARTAASTQLVARPDMHTSPDQHRADTIGRHDPAESRYDRLERESTMSSIHLMASHGLLGAKRPRPHKIWKKKFIKVLVVGDSGLGKTTLIRSLMSTPGERMQVHDGSYTPSEQFRRDPESLLSMISWRDEEDRCIWVYRIQDTPGYGDDLNIQNSIDLMLKFVEEQNHKWLELEQSRHRKEDLAEVEDPRVDVCLFCIPPHRLRPIDLKYMHDLGRHVPIIPVVTKADTMTIREAGLFRTEVANKIANPMLPGIKDKICVFKFERDTLERAGVQDRGTPVPPFLVVASNDINEELNTADPPTFWPERRYPWGVAEAFNSHHSDLLALRALLLKEALEEIDKSKRQRYEEWRRRTLGGVQAGRKLWRTLLYTIVPAVVCLHIGRSGLKMDDVRQHLSSAASTMKRGVNRRPREPEVVDEPPPPPPLPATPVYEAPPKKSFGLF